MKSLILDMIRNRTVKVAVFGLGHVGLPNATLIAEAGFQVIGVDIDLKKIVTLSRGESYMRERGLSETIMRVMKRGLLRVTSESDVAIKEADILIVCVSTPIKENKTPDLSYLEEICKNIAKNLERNKLIIIESTIPPKTTETFIAPMLEEGSGLRCGADFWLAYCPERIIPGKGIRRFTESDRIVGGYSAESVEIALEFLKTFIKGQILATDATTAEVAKLSENTFRDINIAFANELALLCGNINVDVFEVIKLANTHPRVNIHMPGPGVGGPCIPKDPYLLLHSTKPMNHDLIRTARRINDYMPRHIVNLVLQALRNMDKAVKGSKIAVLGTAYKANVGDSRLSPSEPIIHGLRQAGAEVTVYDPHCNQTYGAKRADSLLEAIKGADCLAIITDHAEFENLNLREIRALMNGMPVIIDGRNLINPYEAEVLGFIYFGIGSTKPRDAYLRSYDWEKPEEPNLTKMRLENLEKAKKRFLHAPRSPNKIHSKDEDV